MSSYHNDATLDGEVATKSCINDDAIAPIESIQCYVREFLAKPNPLLGRQGPTCPFVPSSLKMDLIYLAVITKAVAPNKAGIQKVALSMLERFKQLEPTTGVKAQYKAIILIFPDVSLNDAPDVIDGTQKHLKPHFVNEGLMLGEFHLRNNACGLRNSQFYPLRTPHPCLAIRNMVPSDIVFLNNSEFSAATRKSMINRFLHKFGDAGPHDKETEFARKLLAEL